MSAQTLQVRDHEIIIKEFDGERVVTFFEEDFWAKKTVCKKSRKKLSWKAFRPVGYNAR